MKNKVNLVLIIFLMVFILGGCSKAESGQGVNMGKELVLEEIQNQIIRFHVLANSNTKEDQDLKLKVRDKVIEEMSSKFSGCRTIEEARTIILSNMDEVNTIAEEVIKENGYKYSVKCELARENFPDKMYGDTLFPQGNYEAFRILIGEANGQNWWCVMFPPLCFIDESKQTVNTEETKAAIENIVDNKDKQKDIVKPKEKIKFKLKFWEIFSKK